MEWLEILNEIFRVCIVPLLGILTACAVKCIKAKSAEIATNQENAEIAKYVELLGETVSNCVIATNQTYVNALKEKNAFDKEAQLNAFKMTYESVMSILSEDAQKYLTHLYGDLSEVITSRIEAEIQTHK